MSDPVLQYFTYEHLPARLQTVSKPFCDLAQWMHNALPANEQRALALTDLLRAKDAAVRAVLAKP